MSGEQRDNRTKIGGLPVAGLGLWLMAVGITHLGGTPDYSPMYFVWVTVLAALTPVGLATLVYIDTKRQNHNHD